MAVRKAASAKRLLLCGGEKGGLGSEKGGFGEAASPDVAVKMAASVKRRMWQSEGRPRRSGFSYMAMRKAALAEVAMTGRGDARKRNKTEKKSLDALITHIDRGTRVAVGWHTP